MGTEIQLHRNDNKHFAGYVIDEPKYFIVDILMIF